MKKESTKYQRISLLESLLRQKEWTKQSLLVHFRSEGGDSIDERTLSRYLKEMAETHSSFVRKDNQIGRESTFTITVADSWIDDESILALKKMSQQLNISGNAQYKDLLEHVVQFLEERSVPQKLQQSDTHCLISHGPFAVSPESLTSSAALSKILSAIDKRQAIRIGKYTMSSDTETLIEFYPLKMVLRVGQLYVMGYGKADTTSLRTLRLDRMKGIIQILAEQIPERFFGVQQTKKIQEFYKYKFSQWSNEEDTSGVETIILKSKEAWFMRHMKDASFDPPAKCDPAKKTISLRLYVTIDFERWLAGRVVTGACEIVSPKSLKNRITECINALR